MVLKAAGLVIVLINKLLIVGDSVMGCFVQASGDGDASPDAVLARVAIRAIRQGREGNNLVGRFADPLLPASRPVLPSAMSEERAILG
jgi:hypothetical protein